MNAQTNALGTEMGLWLKRTMWASSVPQQVQAKTTGQGSKPKFKVGRASSQVLTLVSSKYIFQLPAATGQYPLIHADFDVCLPGQTQGISTSDAFSLLLSPLISLFSFLILPHTESIIPHSGTW